MCAPNSLANRVLAPDSLTNRVLAPDSLTSRVLAPKSFERAQVAYKNGRVEGEGVPVLVGGGWMRRWRGRDFAVDRY